MHPGRVLTSRQYPSHAEHVRVHLFVWAEEVAEIHDTPMLKPSCLAEAALSRTNDDTPTCKPMLSAQGASKGFCDSEAPSNLSDECPCIVMPIVARKGMCYMPGVLYSARYIGNMSVTTKVIGFGRRSSPCEAQVLQRGHRSLHRR